jgi:hypothetical protein
LSQPEVRTGSGTLAITSASTFLMLVAFTLPLTTITGAACGCPKISRVVADLPIRRRP